MIEECLVVEFRVRDDDCPLADATRATGVEVTARPPLLRSDGYALLRFGAPTSEALPRRLDADDRLRYLHMARAERRDTFRCLSTQPCVVHELIDVGFLAETLRYRGDDTTFVGAVVGPDVLQGIIDRAAGTVGVRLERVDPLGPEAAAEGIGRPLDLTAKQREALRAAFEAGYFAVPRGATAGEVAADLGISKSAFLGRLRRGQASLFEQFL